MFLAFVRVFYVISASLLLVGAVTNMSQGNYETGLLLCMLSSVTCGIALGLEQAIKNQESIKNSQKRISVDELYGRKDPDKRRR